MPRRMIRRRTFAAALAAAVAVLLLLAVAAGGEQAASQVRGFQAGLLDAGNAHTCAVLDDGSASCWGFDGQGQLGHDAPLAWSVYRELRVELEAPYVTEMVRAEMVARFGQAARPR